MAVYGFPFNLTDFKLPLKNDTKEIEYPCNLGVFLENHFEVDTKIDLDTARFVNVYEMLPKNGDNSKYMMGLPIESLEEYEDLECYLMGDTLVKMFDSIGVGYYFPTIRYVKNP